MSKANAIINAFDNTTVEAVLIYFVTLTMKPIAAIYSTDKVIATQGTML